MDVIPTVVHQLTEKIQFLTAGLKLHQLAQPKGEMKQKSWEDEEHNDLYSESKSPPCDLFYI